MVMFCLLLSFPSSLSLLRITPSSQERHEVFKGELVCNAFSLAARAYSSHPLRKDGTSQLSHCVLAALTLADLGLDENTVAAGLLHESLRGNASLRSQLEEFMPSEVVQMVDRVTTMSEIRCAGRSTCRDEAGMLELNTCCTLPGCSNSPS